MYDYCVTKGKILMCSFCFYWRAGFLSSNCTPERVSWIKFSGYPLSVRHILKCLIVASYNVTRDSPLIKPLFTPDGWHVESLLFAWPRKFVLPLLHPLTQSS